MDWMAVIQEIADEMERRGSNDAIDGHVTMSRHRLYAWADDLREALREARGGVDPAMDTWGSRPR